MTRTLTHRLTMLEAADRAARQRRQPSDLPPFSFDYDAFATAYADLFAGMSEEEIEACFATWPRLVRPEDAI